MKNTGFSSNERLTSLRPAAPTPHLNQTAVEGRSRRDEVARRAYFIYLDQGCPQGLDVQHWLEAEAQLMAPPKAVRAVVLR